MYRHTATQLGPFSIERQYDDSIAETQAKLLDHADPATDFHLSTQDYDALTAQVQHHGTILVKGSGSQVFTEGQFTEALLRVYGDSELVHLKKSSVLELLETAHQKGINNGRTAALAEIAQKAVAPMALGGTYSPESGTLTPADLPTEEVAGDKTALATEVARLNREGQVIDARIPERFDEPYRGSVAGQGLTAEGDTLATRHLIQLEQDRKSQLKADEQKIPPYLPPTATGKGFAGDNLAGQPQYLQSNANLVVGTPESDAPSLGGVTGKGLVDSFATPDPNDSRAPGYTPATPVYPGEPTAPPSPYVPPAV